MTTLVANRFTLLQVSKVGDCYNQYHVTFFVGNAVICKGTDQPMQCCEQEEANTKICVRVKDALNKGARNILVSTVDTDVVVLLVSVYWQLHDIWVAFGTDKHFRYYNINSVCQILVCKHAKLCLISMPLQDVIPPHNSLEKERNLLGNPVKLIQKHLKHLVLLQIIHFRC